MDVGSIKVMSTIDSEIFQITVRLMWKHRSHMMMKMLNGTFLYQNKYGNFSVQNFDVNKEKILKTEIHIFNRDDKFKKNKY